MTDPVLLTRIMVRDLPVLADIGINPHEIGRRQPLIVTVALSVDAPADDVIGATVDYRLVAQAAQELGGERIALIETFGRRLASRCLGFPGVREVAVTIDKPEALPAGVASVSLTLLRDEPRRDRDAAGRQGSVAAHLADAYGADG